MCGKEASELAILESMTPAEADELCRWPTVLLLLCVRGWATEGRRGRVLAKMHDCSGTKKGAAV